jgi:ubiquinone/menaquinone biosynthesis C-methylase UbiE
VRRDQGDDHEGAQAHARDRGRPGRGRTRRSGGRLTTVSGIFDRAAPTYDRAAFPFFTPFGEQLVERASIRPDERVIDVGCGAGAALRPAAERAREAVGIDLSAKMAERARAAAPGAEVLVGDGGTLPFGAGRFEVVLSAFTVFFFAEPGDALREWRRVLTPDGRLALMTWGDSDPRWDWERAVRGTFLPEIAQGRLATLDAALERVKRFDDPAKVERELRRGGFETDGVEEHAIEFRFPDEQAWWDWNWSHGTRAFLEELPEPARERFRAQANEAMEAVRDGDGAGFPRTYTALIAVASPA